MCRIKYDLIAKIEDLLKGIVEKACDLALAIGIEVRATDVADEQRVSGEHADWPIGIGSVVKNESKMIVGVPRRFQHAGF